MYKHQQQQQHHHNNNQYNSSPPLTPQLHHHHSNNQQQQQTHPNNDYFYEDSNSEIYIDQTYNHGRTNPSSSGPPPPPPPPRISKLQPIPSSSSTRPITPVSNMYGSSSAVHNTRPHTTTPSEYSSVLSKSNKSTKNKGGVVIETMSAPNPCCPDSKGVCCVLLLVNLGLLLVTLGFSIVLQLFEPVFVWYCGLLFLIVGFIALIVSLLFCMRICTFSRWYNNNDTPNSSIHGGQGVNGGGKREPSELYWTHHWQKRINLPGNTSRASS